MDKGFPQRRQVFDLPPPPPPEVTEHRAHAARCAQCGGLTRAEFPEGVEAPVQYGPRIAAMAVYLQNAQFVPELRLAEIMRDLFAVPICAGTLASMTRRAARRWEACSDWLRGVLVSSEEVKHLDETGFRIAGRGQWLHVLSTSLLTHYRTSPRRGILVHDHWGTYFKARAVGVLHACCNAHHLRELQALVEIEGEGWARRMQRLLRRANRAVHIARAAGQQQLPGSLLQRIERRYDRLLAEALKYHESLPALRPAKPGRRGRKKRRKGHNLALRLRDRRSAVLRFLSDLRVPFTNNQAEQDLRLLILTKVNTRSHRK